MGVSQEDQPSITRAHEVEPRRGPALRREVRVELLALPGAIAAVLGFVAVPTYLRACASSPKDKVIADLAFVAERVLHRVRRMGWVGVNGPCLCARRPVLTRVDSL